MDSIFTKLLEMSIVGCYSTIVVMLVRRLLWKCERKYSYCLWIIVFLNLCIPFSIHSHFSLIPKRVAEFSITKEEKVLSDSKVNYDIIYSQANKNQSLNRSDSPDLSETSAALAQYQEKNNAKSTNGNGRTGTIFKVAEIIWLLGVFAIIGVDLIEYLRLKKRIMHAENIYFDSEQRICETDIGGGAFLFGLFHPIIYLPRGLSQEERAYVLAHELYHKKRKDYLLKPAALCITEVHWFNPFAWIAYLLFCQDMEVSCDEKVMSDSSGKIRRQYAESLLKFAAAQSGFTFTALNFGKPALESRIKNVLKEKKKSVVFTSIAVAGVIIISLGLMLRPANRSENNNESDIYTEADNTKNDTAEKTENNQKDTDLEAENSQNAAAVPTDVSEKENAADKEPLEFYDMAVIGTPCEPEKAGWDMSNVLDVRNSFGGFSYEPEVGTENYTYLLAQTYNFNLYGKGDFQTMLLEKNGSYALILCEYMSNWGNLPEICEADYDGDKETELSIILNLLHGTGVSVDTFFIADQSADGSLYVYQYLDDDYLEELRGHLLFDETDAGTQPYVDGEVAGFALFAGENGKLYDNVSIGDQVKFSADVNSEGKSELIISAEIAFWTNESAIANYNGSSIRASVKYGDGGNFSLRDVGVVVHNDLNDQLLYEAQDYYMQGFGDPADIQYGTSPAKSVQVENIDYITISETEVEASCQVFVDGKRRHLNFLLKPYKAEKINRVGNIGTWEIVQVWETEIREVQYLKQRMRDFSKAYFTGDTVAIKEFLSASFDGDIEVFEDPQQANKMITLDVRGLKDINALEASEEYTLSKPFIAEGEDTWTYLSATFINENGEWKISGYGLEK